MTRETRSRHRTRGDCENYYLNVRLARIDNYDYCSHRRSHVEQDHCLSHNWKANRSQPPRASQKSLTWDDNKLAKYKYIIYEMMTHHSISHMQIVWSILISFFFIFSAKFFLLRHYAATRALCLIVLGDIHLYA